MRGAMRVGPRVWWYTQQWSVRGRGRANWLQLARCTGAKRRPYSTCACGYLSLTVRYAGLN